MKTLLHASALAVIAAWALPQTAFAQDAPNPADTPSIFDGDYAIIGLGAGIGPSYEGSDNSSVFPTPLLQGSIDGFQFSTRGPGLFVDIIRDQPDSKVNFILGPLVRGRLDRNSRIDDAVIERLGKRDIAVELGIGAGISVKKLLSPFDSLTFQTDVGFDVAGAHSGSVISPSLTYATPLSTALFVTLSLNADFVDDDYASYYYTITPQGNAASGLPIFQAEGGLKSIGTTFIAAYDLSGDVRDGGWGVFGLASYSKLQNDAAATPITAIQGDADQFFTAVGVTYSF